jgi:hypothetical protein
MCRVAKSTGIRAEEGAFVGEEGESFPPIISKSEKIVEGKYEVLRHHGEREQDLNRQCKNVIILDFCVNRFPCMRDMIAIGGQLRLNL